MAAVFNLFWLIVIPALMLINNAEAQYRMQPIPYGQQALKPTATHPLISTLLSTYSTNMPIVEKLNTLATVIQKMPPKCTKAPNKRIYMVEALKNSALESLMMAANACKCHKNIDNVNVIRPSKRQVTVRNDRPVNVRYV
ncbi:uncharacterized protein LOC126912102 [Spodoptera frugiperda]|uniref:Uncharacterized protein LOC126912102 n=1 Tax=Spodoptera frugiperda TaxID=7108 RepID=A0A9R0E3I8_SPOFR|nr:uncharacterized protein LOC126912102 [Spodoptera frugiperda]